MCKFDTAGYPIVIYRGQELKFQCYPFQLSAGEIELLEEEDLLIVDKFQIRSINNKNLPKLYLQWYQINSWQSVLDAYHHTKEIKVFQNLLDINSRDFYLLTTTTQKLGMRRWQKEAEQYQDQVALIAVKQDERYYPLTITEHPQSPVFIVPKVIPSEIIDSSRSINWLELNETPHLLAETHLIIH